MCPEGGEYAEISQVWRDAKKVRAELNRTIDLAKQRRFKASNQSKTEKEKEGEKKKEEEEEKRTPLNPPMPAHATRRS